MRGLLFLLSLVFGQTLWAQAVQQTPRPAAHPPCVNFTGNYKGTCSAQTRQYSSTIKVQQFQPDRADLGDSPGQYCSWLQVATASDPTNLFTVQQDFYQVIATYKSNETRVGVGYTQPQFNEDSATVSRWNDTKDQFIVEKTVTDHDPHFGDKVTLYVTTFKLGADGHLLVSETRPNGGYGWDTSCDYAPVK